MKTCRILAVLLVAAGSAGLLFSSIVVKVLSFSSTPQETGWPCSVIDSSVLLRALKDTKHALATPPSSWRPFRQECKPPQLRLNFERPSRHFECMTPANSNGLEYCARKRDSIEISRSYFPDSSLSPKNSRGSKRCSSNGSSRSKMR
jgi:hypothetical protein